MEWLFKSSSDFLGIFQFAMTSKISYIKSWHLHNVTGQNILTQKVIWFPALYECTLHDMATHLQSTINPPETIHVTTTQYTLHKMLRMIFVFN